MNETTAAEILKLMNDLHGHLNLFTWLLIMLFVMILTKAIIELIMFRQVRAQVYRTELLLRAVEGHAAITDAQKNRTAKAVEGAAIAVEGAANAAKAATKAIDEVPGKTADAVVDKIKASESGKHIQKPGDSGEVPIAR